MEREQVIQALYNAKTEAAIEKAGDDWTAFYQTASKEDQDYLAEAMLKFSEFVFEQSKQSSLEVQAVLAEFEAMKLEANQHQ